MPDRILIATQTYPDAGGISSIIENYVAELDGRYDVHVAIVEERPGRRGRLRLPEDRVHVLGYTNLINPLIFPTSLGYATVVGARLRQVVRRVDPAVLIVQDALHLPVPGLLAVSGRRTRLVVMDHGVLTNVHEKGWIDMVADRIGGLRGIVLRLGFLLDKPWRAARWRLGVRFADQLWFTGEELERWFADGGERRRRYSQSVPSDFRPAAPHERTRARSRFGIADEAIVLNLVGRLDGEKGLHTVVEALEPEVMRQHHAVLLIAGDGSLEDELRRWLTVRRLDDVVRILGRLNRDEVRVLHHASDYHVYAGTISCGVSICLLEAMAAGVVPIVSDVPRAQVPLVGESGWIFPAGDADALRRALHEALELDDGRRCDLAARARQRVHSMSDASIPALVQEVTADTGAV